MRGFKSFLHGLKTEIENTLRLRLQQKNYCRTRPPADLFHKIETVSCPICGRPMARNADAHPECKRSL